MPGTPKRRVMLVEDDPGVLTALGKTLLAAGYVVIPATNGAEAVRLWREGRSDLVILDMFMPEKDGLETIVELQGLTPDVPIIAITGGGTHGRFDVLKDAERLGAVETFKKPFDTRALLAAVARIVDNSRGEETGK
jgi:two-component system, chemotaxis family, chemotaxis protein CheY